MMFHQHVLFVLEFFGSAPTLAPCFLSLDGGNASFNASLLPPTFWENFAAGFGLAIAPPAFFDRMAKS
jgi:hypothetical protein